jgi:hypothetical protein
MMMTRNVVRARPSAIIFYCTNMRAAELCVPLEAELGVPVLDAVSAGVWKCLDLIGVPKTLALGWGRLLKRRVYACYLRNWIHPVVFFQATAEPAQRGTAGAPRASTKLSVAKSCEEPNRYRP